MNRRSAFTLIELLVVVAIIGLLLGILLPAVSHARDQAKLATSQSNLRNLGVAHGSYAAEWGDRQFTLTKDNLSSYGDDMVIAMGNFHASHGGCSTPNDIGCHPGLILGWAPDGYLGNYNSEDGYFGYWMNLVSNYKMVNPMRMAEFFGGFGYFRVPNSQQFAQYVNNRFYDPTFYAPKDMAVWSIVESCFDDPGEYTPACNNYAAAYRPYWSSYCLSPAALYHPAVFRNSARGGYQDPFTLSSAFRTPGMSQATYPDLKTHMLEHHWLQNQRAVKCNTGFTGGTYEDCEPWYFNHSWASAPVTLFFDGHVELLGVREAEQADARHIRQAGHGLWSRDTPLGEFGYFIDLGYDLANTSFHVLTTDGIRGRDKVSG